MKTTLRFQLAVTTLGALAAAWFWALPPILSPLFYLHPSNWTDADLVRHFWHFRLAQPEWVSSPPQYDYLRWAQAETLVRLALVFLGWLGASTWLVRSTCAGGLSHRPTRRLQATARLRLCPMPDAWGTPGLSRNLRRINMRTLLAIIALCALGATAAETNQTTYVGRYLRKSPGPQTYKDAASGTIFYVESDGRHVAAIAQDGKLLWHRDPFADAKLPFYRTKTPHIVVIDETSKATQDHFAKQNKRVIRIVYDSSQFGELDIRTGDFTFGGQD